MQRNTALIALLFVIVIVLFPFLFYYTSNLESWIRCEACEDDMEDTVKDLLDAVNYVGLGDVGTKRSVIVNMEDPCIVGIYLTHVEGSCRQFCPTQPDSCWMVQAESGCDGGTIIRKCLDIDGRMQINSELTSKVSDSDDPWVSGSDYFPHSVAALVEKTSESEVTITRP